MNSNVIKQKILGLCIKNSIDILDISRIKSIALSEKMYDIVVYINNNSKEYIAFAKEYKANKTLGFK